MYRASFRAGSRLNIGIADYLHFMTTRILFNADCPVCNAEICHYRDYAARRGIQLGFDDLNTVDPETYGITRDQAAKRLYVLHDGEIISGIPAFLIIWSLLPRYRWLGKLVNLPLIRHIAIFVYDWILAPGLFWFDQRLQKRTA